MHLYGVSGPFRVYGAPTEKGTHMSFFYQHSPDSPRVHIDLFIGGVEGTYYISPSWGNKQVGAICQYPFRGWQYIDFFGQQILAFKDADAYLSTAYGETFMIPRGMSGGYKGCRSYRYQFLRLSGHFTTHEVHFWGMASSFTHMCEVDTPECHSSYGRETQLLRLLAFVDRLAAQHKLPYSLACDSHVYVSTGRKVPPLYAAVVVRPGDVRLWRTALQECNVSTTFVVETAGDGSMAHVRYSHVSTTRLVMYPSPVELRITAQRYASINVSMHVGSDEEGKQLQSVCRACVECEEVPVAWAEGQLRNQNTGLCVTHRNNQLELAACDEKVWV